MLLRYKPCWVTYGEERKEGRKEARAWTGSHICRGVGLAGMNGALIIYPGTLEIAEWRFEQV